MSAWRQSLPCLAGSIVILAAACHDATGPEPALIASDAPPLAAAKDRRPPTAPTNLRTTEITSFSVSLAWGASTDNSGSLSYRVRNNSGVEIAVPGTQTSAKFTIGLEPLETHTFWVYAVDAASNQSPISNTVTVKLPSETAPEDPNDVTPPTTPTNVIADSYADGSRELQITWNMSTDNVTPRSAILYEVFVNGVHENSSIGVPQTSVYGVAGDNVITVIAIDANGNRSAPGVVTLNIPF
jgi:chitinase